MSLFEIIDAVIPDPKSFLWIAVSVVAAAVDNPYGINTLLADSVSIFFINDKEIFLPENQLRILSFLILNIVLK